MQLMNCIILDDEPLARKGIEEYIGRIPFLNLQGSFASPVDLLKKKKVTLEQCDLLFLDIEMPRIDGLTYLRTLPNPPLAVIITAYPQYALEGFELDVVDYLVKPVPFEKVLKATQKAFDFFLIKNQKVVSEELAYFFIKANKNLIKLFFADILYIEALQNYIKIITTTKSYTVYLTMKDIEENLQNKGFVRIHKSYLVSINKVNGIEGNRVLVGDKKLPISKERRKEVIEWIVGDNLWKRN